MKEVLNDLHLPPALQARLNITRHSFTPKRSFILYLPTVCLRAKQNPALAIATRLANHLSLPLLILGIVLDDAHLPSKPPQTVAFTARKVAFTLQAYQATAPSWASLGAGVLLRVHGPLARTPHHLSLAQRAAVTVLDEPFVYPYRGLVESVEKATGRACVRVDGSTTVPPVSVLSRFPGDAGKFVGVPTKAWMWKKKTDGARRAQVEGAVNGDFDAQEVRLRCPVDALGEGSAIAEFLPGSWLDKDSEAPAVRAWTVRELGEVVVEDWLRTWPGVDGSVGVCTQTDGGAGEKRWAAFSRDALATYAKKRNDILQPHAVSRMSCYLNLGTVSIFQIVHDLWADSRYTAKFEDEIIKWREISYAHTFASGDYFAPAAVPVWAKRFLELKAEGGEGGKYSLEVLSSAKTTDTTWNAMQAYLNETGELHNNARMTWGKTIVEWQASVPLDQLLEQLAFLNDRFAADGLSPQSYAGLLWCLGWCDKPGAKGSITTKPASSYRVKKEGFDLARRRLMEGSAGAGAGAAAPKVSPTKRKSGAGDMPSVASAKKTKNSIASYFPK